MANTYTIELVRDQKREPAEIEVFEEKSGQSKLTLRVSEKKWEAVADDCFSALQGIRRMLERDALAIYCYGSSRHVFPSGMSRTMGDGRKAYRLSLGQPGRLADLVDIFTVGSDIELASVEEQEIYFRQWIASLGKR